MIKILTYYVITPAIFLIICWQLRKEKRYLYFVCTEGKKLKGATKRFRDYDKEKNLKSNDDTLKKSYEKIKKLQIYLVIALIIILPLLNFITADLAHEHAHITKVEPTGMDAGSMLGERDPVMFEIKPSYDIGSIKEKMKEESKTFRPYIVFKSINIDELTKVPGKMAVYRLIDNRILITYNYISPCPIMKGFAIRLYEDGEDITYSVNQKTYVYPDFPTHVSNFEKIR